MKDISDGFRAHMRQGHTSFARLWSLTLTNGVRLFLTDNDQDIFYNGDLYVSDPGITISSIQDTVEGGFSDATVDLAVTEHAVTEEMVRYNVISGATFNIERVFYDHLELGTIYDFGGSVREAEITDRRELTLSVDGAGSIAGAIQVGEVYSERCRNVFGDFRCKVDLKQYEVPFYVTGTDEAKTKFYMSISVPEDYENEANPELSTVSETIYEVPGDYTFTVPDCSLLSVIVLGSGGGQGDLWSKPPAQLTKPNGDDGQGSSFGAVQASGGKGGGLFHNGAAGTGTGGSYGGSDGQPGGAGLDMRGVPFGGFGGNGGKATKSYEVGPGKELQVGQQIAVSVGKGGDSETTIGIDGLVAVYYRGYIETIDENESIYYGTVLWLTGLNAGFVHSISNIEDGLVTLDYNMNYPVAVGDRGLFRPGCNHYRSDCKRYDNIPNYRGEPDVPNFNAAPPPADPGKPAPAKLIDDNGESTLSLPFVNSGGA